MTKHIKTWEKNYFLNSYNNGIKYNKLIVDKYDYNKILNHLKYNDTNNMSKINVVEIKSKNKICIISFEYTDIKNDYYFIFYSENKIDGVIVFEKYILQLCHIDNRIKIYENALKLL
jgi:hypothetical protein